MKKFIFAAVIIAAGLVIFSINISAEQPATGLNNNQTTKTLVMQASWKPGAAGNSSSSSAWQWQTIQFGDDFVPVENDEVVTDKSAECLFCHEFQFSELAKLTADWADPWGDPVNPHTYVDEDKADPHHGDKIVPDCLKCHKEHELPAPTSKVADAKLNYCYSCHHEQTFEVCSDCH